MNPRSERIWIAAAIILAVCLVCIWLGFGAIGWGAMRPPTSAGAATAPVLTPTFKFPSSIPTQTPTALPVVIRPALRGRLAFTCTRGGYNHICLLNTYNSAILQLTDGELNDYYPSVGVDGYVYFASQRSLPFRLYRVPFDGGVPEQVADTAPGEHSAPELSPDGQWLVFAADVDNGMKLIYRVHPDGSGLQALVGSGYNVDPTWSPDGTQVAFASLTPAGDGVQLFVMDLVNATVFQVTFGVAGIGGRSAWSPDGRFLVFYAGPKGDKDIYRVELATGQIVQLTDGGNNTAPTWSPDGSWIAFSSMRDGDFDLYVIRPDGSDLLQLTYNSVMDDWQPRWGP